MMKNIIVVFSLCAAIFAFGNTYAGESITVGQSADDGLVINENSLFEFSGVHRISEFTASETYTDKGVFTRLVVPGYSRTDHFGYPEMPANRKLIKVPLGATALVEIIHANYEEIDLNKEGYPNSVFPAQPPMSKSDDTHEFIINQEAYQIAGFGEQALVSVDMLGILRDKRIARINFVPFQYDPVQHKLRVYYNIEFRISFENADIPATLALAEKYASPCFRAVDASLINVEDENTRENFMLYPIKYLIIADRMFESQLQSFIDWKTKKGFMVVESYTDESGVGSTLSSIKSYIQGIYNAGTPDDPAPSYVLFVGDIQQIPTWDNGNGATDRNYCEFTGDLFPEIYYGRFSAQNTAQLQPYIDKTLQYEQYTMPDPTYLDEVVMVAGVDANFGYNWGNGQINYGTINYFNPDHGITSHTYLNPQAGGASQAIRQDISDGVTFGNYTAHCSPSGWADPSFVISDIPNLQNQDMYCVLVGNCCSSSEYQLSECFGEAILRTPNKGAVGYIGASNSTYWDEDYYFGVGVGNINANPPPYAQTTLGYYDRAFHDHGEDFGEWYVSGDEMIFAGNLAVTEGSPGSAQYYWDIYNFMGDPSLMVFFSNPPEIAVSYLPILPLQSTSFTVTTEAYAYVGLSMDNVYIASALAGADGIAILEFPAITVAGIGDIVVTKQNGQPNIGTVVISSPSGPYIMLDEVIISDASGNNNGKADCGEDIALDVSLENVGFGEATNTTATISGADDYVTITQNTHQWPDIPGQTTLMEEDAFEMSIAAYVPDQHIAHFNVEIESSTKEIWNYTYNLLVNAPVLTIEEMIIDDSQGGNDNGRLDPGETAILKVVNKNKGHCPAYNTNGQLTSMSQYLTFVNNTYDLETLGTFGPKYAEFTVSVDPDAPDGAAFAEFNYTVISGEYSASKVFNVKIGLIIEDFETGNFTKFPWEMGGNTAWQITSAYPYEGTYSAKSGNIADGQTTELYIDIEVMIADSVFFVYKISSQLNKDKLKFYIGNSLKGEWSGVGGSWTEAAFYVPTGVHTLKWIYEKDASGMSGSDCAWLDNIIFPPLMTLTCYAGPDAYTCIGEDFTCQGQATDWISVVWSSAGDGSFDDPNVLEAIYTPGSDDISNGSVELTITAEDSDGSFVDDEMTLMVIDSPETANIPTGPEYVNLNNVSVSEYTVDAVPYTDFYEWRVEPIDAGDITGIGTIGTMHWNASFLGIATISVRATNSCGDGGYSEGLEVTVDNTTSIDDPEAEITFMVYPNPGDGHFTLMATTEGSNVNISVYSILGEKVYERKAHLSAENAVNINLGQYPKGLYILSVTTDERKYTEKLIIR